MVHGTEGATGEMLDTNFFSMKSKIHTVYIDSSLQRQIEGAIGSFSRLFFLHVHQQGTVGDFPPVK